MYVYVIFGCSKKLSSNKTRQVVNSTHVSGAADRLRFIALKYSNPISGSSKELVLFFVLAFSSLLFFDIMTPC